MAATDIKYNDVKFLNSILANLGRGLPLAEAQSLLFKALLIRVGRSKAGYATDGRKYYYNGKEYLLKQNPSGKWELDLY